MSDIQEISQFNATVNQVEDGEPITGGAAGNANKATKALANRTKWLNDNKSNQSHDHDSRYYTETEINNFLSTKLALGDISSNTATQLKSMLDAAYKGGIARTHGIRRIQSSQFTRTTLESLTQVEAIQVEGWVTSSLLPKAMSFPRISCLSVDTLSSVSWKILLLSDNYVDKLFIGKLLPGRIVWNQLYIDSNQPVKVVVKKYNHGDIVPYLTGYPHSNHRFFPSGIIFGGKPYQQAASFIFMVAHSTPTSYLTTTSYTESTAFTFNRLICWRAHDALGNYALHAGSSLVTTIAWL